MANFQVQLKQGATVKSVNVEADNYENVLLFFQSVTTMKVTEIKKVEYQMDGLIPSDDMQYYPVVKTIGRNDDQNIAKQFLLNNIKLTINENELFAFMKQYLTIDGFKIDSVLSTVFKSPINS